MKIPLQYSLKRLLLLLLGLMSGYLSFAINYNVTVPGGNRNTPGTFAWCLDKANSGATNDVITIDITVVNHAGAGPNNGTDHQWTISKAAGSLEIVGNGNTLDGSLLSAPLVGNNWRVNVLAITNTNPARTGGLIYIHDLIIKGAPTNTVGAWDQAGNGVNIAEHYQTGDGVGDITFENCQFLDNDNTGLNVSSTGVYNNIKLIDCIASDNEQSGIQINNVTNFEVTRGDYHANGAGGIYFQDGNNGVIMTDVDSYSNFLSGLILKSSQNIVVNGGNFRENRESGVQFQEDVSLCVLDNIDAFGNGIPNITSNTTVNLGAGVRFNQKGTHTDNQIINSRIYQNNVHGIEIAGQVVGSSIVNNEIYENGTSYNGETAIGAQGTGVVFQFGGSSDNVIAQNDIRDNVDAGIYMYRFDPNGGTPALHTNNMFYDNTVTRNGGGIVVIASSDSYIVGNTITDNATPSGAIIGGAHGIYFGEGANNGVVYDNTIDGATHGNGIMITDIGVGTERSDNVFILGNSIKDAQPASSGIRIEKSDNAHIGNSAGVYWIW